MKKMYLLFSFLAITGTAFAQNVGIGTITPDASSQLDITSTSKGFLPPRMTTAQRDAIVDPATSLTIFNTTLNCLQTNTGTSIKPVWECLTGNGATNTNGILAEILEGSPSPGGSSNSNGIPVTATQLNQVATIGGAIDANQAAYNAEILVTTTLSNLPTPAEVQAIIDVVNARVTSGGTATVSAYDCGTSSSGSMSVGVAVSGVTQTITATVTTVGTYNLSATANGVTFSGSGTFAGTGAQAIVLTANGTPLAGGNFTYSLTTTPDCSFNRSSASTPIVSSLDCVNDILTGSITANTAASGVYVTVPYTGGNGLAYSSQLITSTGATGLTASLVSGTLANGNGSLIFSITGTANTNGVASFPLTFGGQSCAFDINVNTPAAVVSIANCAAATAGTLTSGQAASGVTQTISYNGGNGGVYNALGFPSSGVTGLTASAVAGSVASGSGNLVLTINGTPSSSGTATFNISFAGATCTFTRTVAVPAATVTTLTCGSAVFNPTSVTQNLAYTGTATVPYTGGNGNAYSAGTGIASTGVTGLTATLQAGTLASGAGNLTYNISGTPAGSGTATFALSFGGQSCNLTVSAAAMSSIPANITISPVTSYFIASVYDQDYIPYTNPAGPATLTTPQAADGSNEATLLDIQGSLTTTGVTISLPYTASGNGNLAAYTQTINIPAAYTQDGISRDVTFSYSGTAYTTGSGTISATLKSVGGTLNAKKLDVQTGIGNDALGYLLGEFTYLINSSNATAKLAVRDIAGIPDRNFANANHRFLYLLVTSPTGKVWLNNNLGADYSNIAKPSFNPGQQAASSTDYHAYGSLYQWGRLSDGHELVNWTSSTAGTLTTTTNTKSTTDVPGHANFILGSGDDWRNPANNNLWQGVNGTNNPCPYGFRLPTQTEMQAEVTASNITNLATAFSSPLKLATVGHRNITGSLNHQVDQVRLWTTTISTTKAIRLEVSTTAQQTAASPRIDGHACRCLKD